MTDRDAESDPDKQSWTLDDDSQASNPGRIRLQPWCWARHYPKWPLLCGAGLAATVAWALWWHWSGWIAFPFLLAINWFYWTRKREHFTHGCINASVVIDLSPMRIAVSTDLTKGDGDFPVVKIIEKKLATVVGGQPKVGTRLATVALYASAFDDDGNEVDLPHWDDFDPVPVECATNDLAAQQRALDSIDEEDFRALEASLARLPDPPPVGLHRLWSDEPMRP